MPDASGAFKGISVPAEAWERVFGATGMTEEHFAPLGVSDIGERGAGALPSEMAALGVRESAEHVRPCPSVGGEVVQFCDLEPEDRA